jgi:hypothetical protein
MVEAPFSIQRDARSLVRTSTYVLVKLDNTLKISNEISEFSVLLRGCVRIQIRMLSLDRRPISLLNLSDRYTRR